MKAIDFLSTWSGRIFSVSIWFMWIIICIEVFGRTFFNEATVWVTQVSCFLFGSFVLIGGAWTLMNREHVSMSMLYDRLSSRGQAIIDCLTFFVFLALVSVLVTFGTRLAYQGTLVGETAQLYWSECPIWPFLWTIPVGALLLGLAGINKFVRDLYFAIKKEEIR
jgi:TRAP-type mannitol/chloroaromatic compound transport system permease small subunit